MQTIILTNKYSKYNFYTFFKYIFCLLLEFDECTIFMIYVN